MHTEEEFNQLKQENEELKKEIQEYKDALNLIPPDRNDLPNSLEGKSRKQLKGFIQVLVKETQNYLNIITDLNKKLKGSDK